MTWHQHTQASLVEQLVNAGYTDAHTTAQLPEAAVERPWYLSLMQGVGAWFAGLFCMVFFVVLMEPLNGYAATLGFVLLAVAFCLLHVSKRVVFLEQLGMALSLAAQCFLIYAMFETWHIDDARAWLYIALMQAALALLMPSALHRTLSTLFALCALAWWLRGDPQAVLSNSAGRVMGSYAMLWLPVMIASAVAVACEHWWLARAGQLVRPILHGMIIALAWLTTLGYPFEHLFLGDTQSMSAPLIAAFFAVIAFALSFALRNTGLSIMAGSAAFLHMVGYYYWMNVDLLQKSLTLFVLAVILLVVYAVLRKLKLGAS